MNIKSEQFHSKLEEFLGKNNIYIELNIPNHVLAEHIQMYLHSLRQMTEKRDEWFGFEKNLKEAETPISLKYHFIDIEGKKCHVLIGEEIPELRWKKGDYIMTKDYKYVQIASEFIGFLVNNEICYRPVDVEE